MDADANALKSAWYAYPASGSVGALAPKADGTQTGPRTIQFALGQLPAREGAEVRVQFPHRAFPGLHQPGSRKLTAPTGCNRRWRQWVNSFELLLTLAILAGGGVR